MLKELLEFLKEDVGEADITTDATVSFAAVATAEVVAREDGVLAGLFEAGQLLEHEGLLYKTQFADGSEIKKGSLILELSGNARKILSTERVMLNILMRMSGIATFTSRLQKQAAPYGVKIAGTRKTTPGFRNFEKKAIEIGGGWPHRQGLYDAFLIKDNHIAVAGLGKAIRQVREWDASKAVEVEVSTTEDALSACRMGVDILMLDNMAPEGIDITMKEIEKEGFRDKVKIELSGGITAKNLEQFLKSKPDIISMGELTTGAKWLDMSVRIKIADD
ncbi:carboxylating nicotinate-nucleotide diphosphorylase [archaeon]|nr:carboxylating nicotinate-nucleotide diphosphorylase [archaeon]